MRFSSSSPIPLQHPFLVGACRPLSPNSETYDRHLRSCRLTFLLPPRPRSANSTHPFTHILLADCLWYSEMHYLLLSSLVRLLAPTPTSRIHICAGFHSGRSTVRSFLRKAKAVGLVRRGKWEEVGHKGERRAWGWDVQRVGGQEEGEGAEQEEAADEWEEKENGSERNKWVVEGELGWSDEKLREVEGRKRVEAVE